MFAFFERKRDRRTSEVERQTILALVGASVLCLARHATEETTFHRTAQLPSWSWTPMHANQLETKTQKGSAGRGPPLYCNTPSREKDERQKMQSKLPRKKSCTGPDGVNCNLKLSLNLQLIKSHRSSLPTNSTVPYSTPPCKQLPVPCECW